MKLWLELIFLELCIFLIHTNNEALTCPSGLRKALGKKKATHLLVASGNILNVCRVMWLAQFHVEQPGILVRGEVQLSIIRLFL